jgi:hypothetical protein
MRGTHGSEGALGVDEAGGTRAAEGALGVDEAGETRAAEGALGVDEAGRTRRAKGIRGFDDEGIRSALEPEGLSGAQEPDVIQAAPGRRRPPPAHSVRPRQVPADVPAADDEHFVPPTPPPLPKLDSITKGAWAALFGGPGYLVVATAAGWSVSGIAAFCAVAAFVTGFVLLVLRMNEPGPGGGPDDGEDGAVV